MVQTLPTSFDLDLLSLTLAACILLPAILAWIIQTHILHPSPPRGCRPLGIAPQLSNLADEHSPQYSIAATPTSQVVGKVKALFVYPIKSCAGLELARGEVVKTGLKYDRQFAFAEWNGGDEGNGKGKWKFITQRTHPLLTQVRSEVWVPDEGCSTYSVGEPNVRSRGVLVIRYPNFSRGGFRHVVLRVLALFGLKRLRSGIVHLPYDPTPEQIDENGYTLETLTIWKSHPTALLIASTKSQRPQHWIRDLQKALGTSKPLGFFRVAHGHERDPKGCAPSPEDLGYTSVIGFADSYPLHVINLASVHDLAARQHAQAPRLSALQFRPNVYVTGPEVYAEDDWKRVRIGNGEYYVACRTTRCKLPNVNQRTGVVDEGVKEVREAEPEAAMRKTRRIDQGAKLKACMGMMMVPAAEVGAMRVGDEIEVLATGEHFYIN